MRKRKHVFVRMAASKQVFYFLCMRTHPQTAALETWLSASPGCHLSRKTLPHWCPPECGRLGTQGRSTCIVLHCNKGLNTQQATHTRIRGNRCITLTVSVSQRPLRCNNIAPGSPTVTLVAVTSTHTHTRSGMYCICCATQHTRPPHFHGRVAHTAHITHAYTFMTRGNTLTSTCTLGRRTPGRSFRRRRGRVRDSPRRRCNGGSSCSTGSCGTQLGNPRRW